MSKKSFSNTLTIEPSASIALKSERFNIMNRAHDILEKGPNLSRQDLYAVDTLEKRAWNLTQNILEAERAEDARTPRIGAAKPRFRNLAENIRAIATAEMEGPASTVDPRLRQIQAAATGAGEGVPSDGGYLLEPEYAEDLLLRVYNTGELLRRTNVVETSKPELNIRAFNETSRATGSRLGGLRLYRPAEGGTLTASKPTFRNLKFVLKKLIASVPTTSELVADTSFEQILTKAFGLEGSFVLEDEMITGDGINKMAGVLQSSALITVSKEGSQAATSIVGENIVNMYSRFWAPGRASGVWLCNQDIEKKLLTTGLTYGGTAVVAPWYQPASNGEKFGRLLGLPLIPHESCATLGTVGDLLLVDPSEYIIAQRPIDAAMSMHALFTSDEIILRFVWRTDGQPTWPAAVTPKNGTATVSPYVALETRA